jgi:hypothetical protein
MATICIDIDNAQLNRVVDALCAAGGWTAELGVTKSAFAKQEAARIIRERVVSIERHTLLQAAEQQAAAVTEPTVT